MREIKLLQGLRHENVVNIMESAVSRGHVDIVLEYCRGGDLWNYVKSRSGRPFREIDVLSCFADACAAVAHMHEKKIAHWDIKMDNILRASDGTFKLCDFGSCQRSRLPCERRSDFNKVEELIQKYTSPIYRAPEMIVILNNSIGVYEVTEKVDVWALGCVLYSLAYFVHPFAQSTNLGILGARYKIPDTPRYSKTLLNLIKYCLEIEVEDRVSSSEIHKLVKTAMKGESVGTKKKKKKDATKHEKKKKKKSKKKVSTKRKSQTKDTVESLFEDLKLEADEDEDEDNVLKQDEKVVSSTDRNYSIHRDDLSDKEKQVAEFATCSFAHARRALIESEGDVQRAIESVLAGRVQSPRKDAMSRKKKVVDEDAFAAWSDEDESFFNQEDMSTSQQVEPSNNSDEIWGVVEEDNRNVDDTEGDVAATGSDDGFDDDFFN